MLQESVAETPATRTERVRAHRERQRPDCIKARSLAEKVYEFLKDHPEHGKAIQAAFLIEVKRAEKVRADHQWAIDHPNGKASMDANEDHE
jgi:hypothetical protein